MVRNSVVQQDRDSTWKTEPSHQKQSWHPVALGSPIQERNDHMVENSLSCCWKMVAVLGQSCWQQPYKFDCPHSPWCLCLRSIGNGWQIVYLFDWPMASHQLLLFLITVLLYMCYKLKKNHVQTQIWMVLKSFAFPEPWTRLVVQFCITSEMQTKLKSSSGMFRSKFQSGTRLQHP